MSLKLNVIKIEMLLNLESHSTLNVTQIWISLKLKCHLIWMSLKLKCHSNCNVTQIWMSLKFECHSNLNVTQIGRLNRLK